MPYTHKKVGDKYVVYKGGKKVGSTKGTKAALDKYLAALHINADKKESKSLKENQEMQEGHPHAPRLIQDLEFWVVEKAPTPDADPMDLVYKSSPISFGYQIAGGLDPADLLGFYLDENEAMDAAHDEVSSVFEAAKSLEEKKGMVTSKIEEVIKKLQKEINQHLEEASMDETNPEQHHMQAEAKMAKIKDLRNKAKAVEASKKPLQEKEK